MKPQTTDLRSAEKAQELSHDEINDLIWEALSPEPQKEYPSYIKIRDDYITYEMGGSHWKREYSIQDGKVVLGEPVEGEMVFQPLPEKSVSTAIKSLGEGKVGGYLMVWGSPTMKDLERTYFDADTDLCLDWFPQRPILYEHGQDGGVKLTPMGQFTSEDMRADDVGMWIEGQLDTRARYLAGVERLIELGALNWSSRSLPDLLEVESDGKITKWPLIEATMTTHPAELRFTDVQSIKAVFEEAGLELPKRLLQGAPGEADGGPSGQARSVELRRRRLESLGAGLETKGD